MTDKIKNLCLRTATGIAFVAVLVGGILWSNVTFTLLFAVVTGLSVREFCQVVNRRADVQTNAVICTVAGIYLFLAVSGFCSNLTPSGVFIPYLLSVVYLLVSELYLKSEHALNNWAYTMMSQMYVALPFASLNILTYQPEASYSIGVAYAGMLPFPYSYSFGPVTPELTVSVRFSVVTNCSRASLRTSRGRVPSEEDCQP